MADAEEREEPEEAAVAARRRRPSRGRRGPDAAEEGSGLQPVVVVVHAWSTTVGAAVPFRCSASRPEQQLRERRWSAPAMPVPSTSTAVARDHVAGVRRPGAPRPRRSGCGPASRSREPAQVDRDAEHRVATTATRASGHSPSSTTGPQGHDLGDEPEHARRQPGRKQRQARAHASSGRRRRRLAARARPRVRSRAARRATTGDHGEGDERGDDVGEQVGAPTRADPAADSAASGSTTQPACATVDHASRRSRVGPDAGP